MKTEITVQLYDNVHTLLTKLRNKNAKFIEEYQINDFYFSKYSDSEINSKKYKDILDNSFIVREVMDGKSKRAKIVYKTKKLDQEGNVIAEDKLSVNIDNAELTVDLFNRAGLNCWCELKNHSFVYSISGVEFVIQVVEDLGIFIECEENKSIEHLSSDEKFEYLKKFILGLGLEIGDDFSCKKVYMKYLKDKGLTI